MGTTVPWQGGGPRAPHSPLTPCSAPHQLPWVLQEPPAPQAQREPSFWGRAPRPNPIIPPWPPLPFPPPFPCPPVTMSPYLQACPPAPCPHSPGTHRYWKGATVAVTGRLCEGPEEKVMVPDPNMGPLPCEPPCGSSPVPAVATPLPFPGDTPGHPPPLPCAGGPLGSSVGSPTLPAPLLPLPTTSGHFPGDTRGLAEAFCPPRGGMPGLPSLLFAGSRPVALPVPLGLRALGLGTSTFPGRGDGAPGGPGMLGGVTACGLLWATARGTGMAET